MSKGLEPGAALPDFELPDEDGAMHRLSELQGDNRWCCARPRRALPARAPAPPRAAPFHEWCAVAFTELVTILPNDQHDTNKLKIATGACWTFLSDADLEVQRTLEIDEYTDPHHLAPCRTPSCSRPAW